MEYEELKDIKLKSKQDTLVESVEALMKNLKISEYKAIELLDLDMYWSKQVLVGLREKDCAKSSSCSFQTYLKEVSLDSYYEGLAESVKAYAEVFNISFEEALMTFQIDKINHPLVYQGLKKLNQTSEISDSYQDNINYYKKYKTVLKELRDTMESLEIDSLATNCV